MAAPAARRPRSSARPGGEENGVNVAVQLVPENLQTQFVTASQAGKAPDVVMGAHDWIGNLVQNGAIDPIQMTEDTRAAYEKLAIEAVTFNGQTYGVPFTMNNIVLFRNTDLAPEAPSSIEDLVATGKQLKAAGKTSEILALPVGPTGDPYHINPLYTSGGGYMFGQQPDGGYDPKDLGVGEASSVQAYEKIAALGEKGEGALKRSIAGDNILSLFTAKKVAFMISGPWQFADLKKTKLHYDVSPVPAFEGGKAGQAVHHRRRGLCGQQGAEQAAGPGVRHQLLVDAGGEPGAVQGQPERAGPQGGAGADQGE